MARTSRIQHPPHTRFFKLYVWAVNLVGRDAALTLEAIDFADCNDKRISRQSLIAELEGIVSRNKVDQALKKLEGMLWIRRHKKKVVATTNLQFTAEFSLNPSTINKDLGRLNTRHPQTGNSEKPEQESPDSPPRSPNGDAVYTSDIYLEELKSKSQAEVANQMVAEADKLAAGREKLSEIQTKKARSRG